MICDMVKCDDEQTSKQITDKPEIIIIIIINFFLLLRLSILHISLAIAIATSY